MKHLSSVTCKLAALLGAALLLFAPTASAQASAKRFDLEVAAKIVRLSDPQIAPDGKSIVVVVSRANYEENRWEGELTLVDVATSAQRVLTSGRFDVTQPRWSPTGDRLAFISNAPTGRENKPQLFVLAMNGGEAKRITNAPNGVQHYAWKPDGLEIAFVTADDSPNKKIGDREISFEVGNDHFLTNAQVTSSHIWLTSAKGGKATRLTSGEWSLPITLPPGSLSSPLSWSPDGRTIAFVKRISPHFGDARLSSIQLLDVATGAIRSLTGRSERESQPVFSPDGSRIAYWYPREGLTSNNNEIQVTTAAGGEGVNATRALDRNVFRSIWMPDSKSFITGGNDGTRFTMWQQPLEGAARRIDLGAINPGGSFWLDASVSNDGGLALTGSEPHRPTELYYLPSLTSKPKRLTDFNQQFTSLSLGKVEKIEWTNDEFKMDGVITYPPDFAPGRTYPLVLYIHGGPASASKEVFSERAQLLAARGWVIFEPNYRGSDNLGSKFMRSIFNDAGAGPGRDVMAGLEVLKKRGIVDTTRIAVSGWSYGGFMTTWLIGHYQGWRVAIAGAAVTDNMDQYNFGDANVSRAGQFGGSPWTGDFEKAYREQSPITNAPQIKTPTLILSDTGDVRVPITQSYKLYHALRDNNVPVQFIAYPVAGHSPTDPVRQQDVSRRWIEWIERYFAQTTTSENR
ncbi:MAG: S9 family peptidase [Blastocatellia bacterium]|nr:S9 family peptidase [Blastocatellia bacterium]